MMYIRSDLISNFCNFISLDTVKSAYQVRTVFHQACDSRYQNSHPLGVPAIRTKVGSSIQYGK